jgi:uncharacterized protein YndB with AHSA1/START domain
MSETNVKAGGKEILVTRLLNAPQDLVFEAFTDPKHLVHWYGPDGFTITNRSIDVKTGGSWSFIMHGPDGRDYGNRIIFLEVVKPEKIIYRHSGEDDTENISFHVTVTFQKEGNQTKLSMLTVFSSAEELEMLTRDFHVVEGARQNANRLAEYLLRISTSSN